MSVYVDPCRPCLSTKGWRYRESCHLVADSEEELHLFSKALGLKRGWFQDSSIPHYDLTRKKREAAVKLGAREVSSRWLMEWRRIHGHTA